MTEKEKMLSGDLYLPNGDDIMTEQLACLDLLYEFNQTRPTEQEKRQAMLTEMFAEIGEGCYIEPPFHANWGGKHCHFGHHVYANFNLTMVDDTHIYVGDYTMFGPNVVVASAGHPILPELRERAYQYNFPVHIGRNCWIGAGVVIVPGVTIGDNTVVGAGSVVTKDIPANVVAVGNPCRVLRPIGDYDRAYYFKNRPMPQEVLQQIKSEEQIMKILFIGNSYTYFYDLPQMFEKLCIENGKEVCVHSVTAGGRELHESLNPQDGLHQNIASYLDENKVDVLFMQEQSCLPALNHDLFFQGAEGLHHWIRPKRTIMYATWGRQNGSPELTEFGWTKEQMTDLLYTSYAQAAEKLGGEVSPVGLCFREINATYPNINVYDPDCSHPSLSGSILATICHYYAVFGELPLTYECLDASAEVIDAMKAVVLAVWGG